MRTQLSKYFLVILCLVLLVSMSGVFATWMYAEIPLYERNEPLSFEIGAWQEPEVFDLYITEIELVSGNAEFSKKHPTTVNTSLSVSSNTSVTYKITVHNNTDVTYWYKGQKYDINVGANASIGVANGITVTTKDAQGDNYGSFDTNDWIPPHTYRDFYVTYTYGNNVRGTVENVINFQFGLSMDAIHDQFLVLLNDKNSEYGYNYLANAFDKKYSETGSKVIGNVGDDEAIFNNMFGSNLTISLEGQQVPVTVMVCRQNVDKKTGTGDSYKPSGPTGCEYTVYITVDPLNSATGQAVVYAVSYSCDSNGVWRQVGQLYEGVANRCDYDTTDSEFDGAFNVYTWEATPAYYEVADDIVYMAGLPLGQGDQYDQYKTIEQLMSAEDQDIFNTIDNTKIFKKVYDILVANPGNDKPGIEGLRKAFYDAEPYYDNYNNGQEFKVKRNCTRAEIIPYIIAIQHALDYYNEVNK